jgi:hypothetical protein
MSERVALLSTLASSTKYALGVSSASTSNSVARAGTDRPPRERVRAAAPAAARFASSAAVAYREGMGAAMQACIRLLGPLHTVTGQDLRYIKDKAAQKPNKGICLCELHSCRSPHTCCARQTSLPLAGSTGAHLGAEVVRDATLLLLNARAVAIFSRTCMCRQSNRPNCAR